MLSTTLALSVLLAGAAQAQDLCYDLVEVDVPDADGAALYTTWSDINNANQIVGNYCIDPGCAPVGPNGAIVGGAIHDLDDGSFETFELPAPYTWVGGTAINDRGVVVGEAIIDFATEAQMFVRLPNGQLFFMTPPRADVTYYIASHIDDRGTVYGYFADPAEGDRLRSFVFENGAYRIYDLTDAADGSIVVARNAQGDVLGQDFPMGTGPRVGVVRLAGGAMATLEDPSMYAIGPQDLSSRGTGRIVGWARSAAGAPETGFVATPQGFTYLDMPGAYDTRIHGVNDAGIVVGTFDAYSWGLVGTPCN